MGEGDRGLLKGVKEEFEPTSDKGWRRWVRAGITEI